MRLVLRCGQSGRSVERGRSVRKIEIKILRGCRARGKESGVWVCHLQFVIKVTDYGERLVFISGNATKTAEVSLALAGRGSIGRAG